MGKKKNPKKQSKAKQTNKKNPQDFLPEQLKGWNRQQLEKILNEDLEFPVVQVDFDVHLEMPQR